MASLDMLNLGCGRHYHPDWVNVDFEDKPPDVLGADLQKGIPFQDENFDVVYHSHILEHFLPKTAKLFLKECHRVLRPRGVLRVVVPDLEAIARLYLDKLESALAGEPGAESDYDWMMLELYDQTVRAESGGSMKRYLAQSFIANREFIASRMGWLRQSTDVEDSPPPQFMKKGSRSRWRRLLQPVFYLERLKRMLLGGEYEVLQEGRFRRSGEVHLWMYDRFSLARLLRSVGFVDVRVCEADESAIPGLLDHQLDVDGEGRVRKPDSLFMECRKPG